MSTLHHAKQTWPDPVLTNNTNLPAEIPNMHTARMKCADLRCDKECFSCHAVVVCRRLVPAQKEDDQRMSFGRPIMLTKKVQSMTQPDN